MWQTNFSVTVSPQTLPALLTRRKRLPVLIAAAKVQSFNMPYTQSGIGSFKVRQPQADLLERPFSFC